MPFEVLFFVIIGLGLVGCLAVLAVVVGGVVLATQKPRLRRKGESMFYGGLLISLACLVSVVAAFNALPPD